MLLKTFTVLLLFWNMEYGNAQQKFTIVGTWDGIDPKGNTSTLVFTEDGFFLLTIEGELKGGGGFDFNGTTHSIIYKVEYSETLIQVKFSMVENTPSAIEKTKVSAYLTFKDNDNAELVFDQYVMPSEGTEYTIEGQNKAMKPIAVKLSRRKET